MRHTLDVTALLVAVLLSGFCGTAQAQKTTFTFDGIADAGAYVNATTVTPLVTNGYTMTLLAGGGGILDRAWNTSLHPFTGGVCGGFSGGIMVGFTRNDGSPFAAASVAIGSLVATHPTASWTVTGFFAGGGSERIILWGPAGQKTTRYFPCYFSNLTNLVFTGLSSERPAFDELVLVDRGVEDIDVRDFGAMGDGETDDTAAIQAALTFASARFTDSRCAGTGTYDRAYATLRFPFGHYKISDTLVGSASLLGVDSAIIEMVGHEKNIFENQTSGRRQRIANLTFVGGSNHVVVGKAPLDAGKLIVEDCEFLYSRGAAVRMLQGTFNAQVTIRDCLFVECDQVFINWSDWSRMTDCRITTRREMKNKAVIENRRGKLLFENSRGVPLVDPANDQRWIDNHGSVTCRNVRFGGEGAGFTAVVNFGSMDCADPVDYRIVELDSCWVSVGGNTNRPAIVYCEEVPNQIRLHNCWGVSDIRPVMFRATIDLDEVFRTAGIGGHRCLRFDLDENLAESMGGPYHNFPDQLLRYAVTYIERPQLWADKILETPPVHRAELTLTNGAMTLFLDGEPSSGQMWSSLVNDLVSIPYLTNVLNGLEYPIAGIPFAVGDHSLHNPPLYPATWLGPDEYDWSYIDTQARRVLAARPDMKLVLMLALDGAVWWDEAHPEAANVEVDALFTRYNLAPPGVPDYLSPLWRRDMRELLRQLVAHVQSSDWGKAVIGYELFNGSTMDCNFKVPRGNPRVIADFRGMLTEKYPSDAALQQAWNDPTVTRNSALPWTGAFPPGLILEPASNRWFIDTRELIANQFRMVFSDVAAILKEATQGRALVGARTGDFFGNSPGWSTDWFVMEDSGWLPPLLTDPNFDFFDVQEPYASRRLGRGAGVPVIPPHALQQYGKTVFIQNDVRTHLSPPDAGYGRTPDLETTIQLQRRVFANALTYNMTPYLFQLAFSYWETELLAEYRRQEMILREAATRDRSSVAETAIVFDPEMRLYLGADDVYNEPTRHYGIFDHAKQVWQRAGAPFDMIFLDQIESLPPYRVYVFCNTWRYTPEQMRTIREKVLTNDQCAVFLWADGVISDEGTFSAEALSELTGMNIVMSRESWPWKMSSATGFPGVVEGTEVGTHSLDNYSARHWVYEPSFRIEPGAGTVPLAYRSNGSISAAMRLEADYTVIYSASGKLTPPIFRLALERAGAFSYTDSSALFMMNRSYLAFHTDKAETIHLKLPTAQRLVNLFTGVQHPAHTDFHIPVLENHTYLFERRDD